MNKRDRDIIFNKYGKRCAYCGCELNKSFHVDELLPVVRKTKYEEGYWRHTVTGEKIVSLMLIPDGESRDNYQRVKPRHVFDGYTYPERLNIDNQMPSCASCNINKHSESLERFRESIKGYMKHLNEHSTQYKIAKRYGLVVETDIEVKFYFETLQEK